MRSIAHRTQTYAVKRRGVAILLAISVTAILLILIGGLMAGLQFTEGQRGHDVRQAQLHSLQKFALDNTEAMLLNGNQNAPQSWQMETGNVKLAELRPADENGDSALYKDEHLSLRQGDMVVRIIAEAPYKGESVGLGSTWLLNVTEGQQRRLCLEVTLGRAEVKAGPEEANDSDQ